MATVYKVKAMVYILRPKDKQTILLMIKSQNLWSGKNTIRPSEKSLGPWENIFCSTCTKWLAQNSCSKNQYRLEKKVTNTDYSRKNLVSKPENTVTSNSVPVPFLSD